MNLDDANLIRLIAIEAFSAWFYGAFVVNSSFFVAMWTLCSYMVW